MAACCALPSSTLASGKQAALSCWAAWRPSRSWRTGRSGAGGTPPGEARELQQLEQARNEVGDIHKHSMQSASRACGVQARPASKHAMCRAGKLQCEPPLLASAAGPLSPTPPELRAGAAAAQPDAGRAPRQLPLHLGPAAEDGLPEQPLCAPGALLAVRQPAAPAWSGCTARLVQPPLADRRAPRSQAERFACLYASHVSSLALYSPDKCYR